MNQLDLSTYLMPGNSYGTGKIGVLSGMPGTKQAGVIDFVRNTAAYRMNQAGALEQIAANVPRLDWFDPITGGIASCPSLIASRQLTNRFINSESASDPGQGTRTNLTFSANDWNIGLTGMVLLDSLGNTRDCVYFNVASLPATQHSIGFIARRSDGGVVRVGDQSTSAADLQIVLQTQIINSLRVVNIEGTDLYYITAQRTATIMSPAYGVRVLSTMSTSVPVYVSAIMVIDGGSPPSISDYIRTTGITASRNEDIIESTIDISQSSTVAVDILLLPNQRSSNPGVIWQFDDGTTDNAISLFADFGNNTNVYLQTYSGGLLGAVILDTSSAARHLRIAVSWGDGIFRMAINGQSAGAGDAPFPVGITSLRIGGMDSVQSGWELNGHLANFRICDGYRPSQEKLNEISQL